MFTNVYTYYTGHLWQDEDLVLDETEIDRGSIVYPPRFKLQPPPPLRPRLPLPPLLLHSPLLAVLYMAKSLL